MRGAGGDAESAECGGGGAGDEASICGEERCEVGEDSNQFSVPSYK